jgi:hypothetical protein
MLRNLTHACQCIQTNIGSLTNPTGFWSTHSGFRVPELAWQQSFLSGHIVALAGVVSQGNYIDANTYANTGRGQFINSALINSMVLPLPAVAPAVWHDLDARWKAVLSLEASVDTFRKSAENFRAELEAALRRTLTAVDTSQGASLWDVDDSVSRRFFVAFHRALRGRGRNRLARTQHCDLLRMPVQVQLRLAQRLQGRFLLDPQLAIEQAHQGGGRLVLGAAPGRVVAREREEHHEADEYGEPGREHPEDARRSVAVAKAAALRSRATRDERNGLQPAAPGQQLCGALLVAAADLADHHQVGRSRGRTRQPREGHRIDDQAQHGPAGRRTQRAFAQERILSARDAAHSAAATAVAQHKRAAN